MNESERESEGDGSTELLNAREDEHNRNIWMGMNRKRWTDLKLDKLPAGAADVRVWCKGVLLSRVVRNLTRTHLYMDQN